MFIPPSQLGKSLHAGKANNSKVSLSSSHICIAKEVAGQLFGDSPNVNLVYYPERRTMMLARVDDELFSSLHKAKQHMLKGRNLKGDKTIAIHEILIDNELDSTNRDLVYTAGDGSGILSIQL